MYLISKIIFIIILIATSNQMIEEFTPHVQQKDKLSNLALPNQSPSVRENNAQANQQQHDEQKLKTIKQNLKNENMFVQIGSQFFIYDTSKSKKWSESKYAQAKGRFSVEQQRILSLAVGQFLASNQISIERFSRMINSKNENKYILRQQKFYHLLSNVIPNRSPESCYKFIKRNFNNLNRKGSWTSEQQEKLLDYVKVYGRKWKKIGQKLGRTGDSVYDKYRFLGGKTTYDKTTRHWKFQELVKLLEIVQKQCHITFIDQRIKDEIKQKQFHDSIQLVQLKSHKYNSKSFLFHNIEVVLKYLDQKSIVDIQIDKICWVSIERKIKSRSARDCRDQFIKIIEVIVKPKIEIYHAQIIDFISFASNQKQIKWQNWSNQQIGCDEAKMLFRILKKSINGKSSKTLNEMVDELKKKYTTKSLMQQKQKSE